MTWTYVDPSKFDRDKVRFEIGDTFEKRAAVQDEDIDYALSVEGNILGAAARMCEHLAAKFAREEIVRTAAFTTDKTTISKKYLDMASRLRRRSITAESFLMPAMSVDDKADNEEDTSIVQPLFKRGLHDNQDTGVTDSSDE